jgi:hypothetical protein
MTIMSHRFSPQRRQLQQQQQHFLLLPDAFWQRELAELRRAGLSSTPPTIPEDTVWNAPTEEITTDEENDNNDDDPLRAVKSRLLVELSTSPQMFPHELPRYQNVRGTLSFSLRVCVTPACSCPSFFGITL